MRNELSEDRVDSPTTPDESDSAVAPVFAKYLDRLLAGETFTIDEVLREHPDVDEEVLEQLRSFCELADAPPEAYPRRIGDFEIIREVGRGGMGIVFEAVQISLGRRVALKIVPGGLAADGKAVARFVREAQVSAKLDHPNVVTVYEMGFDQHVPYYAMEFVEGQTLTKRLRDLGEQTASDESPLQNRRYYLDLASYFMGVAEGLGHAHRRGVIHRDLKPSNLIFDNPQDTSKSLELLKILDFGLARFEGQESLTASGDVVGSVRYMSPEQASVASGAAVDHRTDIYSLGAAFYEALTLHPPFTGKEIQDTLSQIQTRDPKLPTKLNPRVPKDIETMVMKCLRKEPDDRYGTAEALAQDLGRFLRGDAIEARPRSGIEQFSRFLRRHRVQIAIATCFLLLLSAVSYLWSRHAALAKAELTRTATKEVLTAAETLRSAPISLLDSVQHPLYILPPGVSLFPSRRLIPPTDEEEKQDIRNSIDKLSDVVRQCPSFADAYFQLARAHLILDQPHEALDALDQVTNLDNAHVPAWLLKASIFDQLDDGDESSKAEEEANRVAAEPYITWLTAHRLLGERQYTNAAAKFKAALQQQQRNNQEPYIGWTAETELALAICYQAQGDFVEVLRQLDGDADDRRAQEAIAYIGLAQKFDDETYTDKADEIFTTLRGSMKAEVAVLTILEYRRLFVRKQIPALDWEFLEHWLQRIPNKPLQLKLRALCCFQSGQFKTGKAALEAAIELDPNDASLYFFLAEDGYGLYRPGDYDTIIRLTQTAVEKDPGDLEYQTSLAFWLLKSGRSDEAATRLPDIDAIWPRRPEFWPCINLGVTKGVLLGKDEGEKFFDQARKIKTSSWLDYNRGLMYRMLADRVVDDEFEKVTFLNQARTAYEASIDLNPRNPFSYQALGGIFRSLGQPDQAIECLMTGWEAARHKHDEIARRLAVVYYENGQLNQADEWLLKALKINGSRQAIHDTLKQFLSPPMAAEMSDSRKMLLSYVESLVNDSSKSTSTDEHRERLMRILKMAKDTAPADS